MTDKQPTTSAALGTRPTRASRLDALCAAYAPGARYEILSPGGDGQPDRKVVITDPESGDRVGAIGTSLDDALEKLAAKIQQRGA